MKPKPKPAAKPAPKLPAPVPVKAKGPAARGAKVLQHPSSPPSKPAKRPAGFITPSKPNWDQSMALKKEAMPWDQFHGLTTVDFQDLIERRQTLYHKIKELEVRLSGKKDDPDSKKASLSGQIQALMTKAGAESVRVDERLVTVATGHVAERVNKDALGAKLLEYLSVEQIEEVMEAVIEGGESYKYLLVTEPKEKATE